MVHSLFRRNQSGGNTCQACPIFTAHGELSLFREQPEHLADILPLFHRNGVILQEIQNLTDHRLIREKAGNVPGQKACCGK